MDHRRAQRERATVELADDQAKMRDHINKMKEDDRLNAERKSEQARHMRMYYNMQHLTRERNLAQHEKLMNSQELGYNKPRVGHLM